MRNQVQLTPRQANAVIRQMYPSHFDYNIPEEDREETNPDWNRVDLHRRNVNTLRQMLTAPLQTEFLVERKYGTGHEIGWTEYKMGPYRLRGRRDETMHHINLMDLFLKAEGYGWFMGKVFPKDFAQEEVYEY